jgi:protoheme IX farnesyltransferase
LRIAIDPRVTFFNYIEILKPRETSLLVFIGACSAVIAADWDLSISIFILTVITITLGTAGCNGLTNYLDREVDGRASRTKARALPSRRIYPPQKVLPLITALIVIALIMAYLLNPLCFIFGLAGTIASIAWRKTVVSCTLFGVIAGCSPVLIGWFALRPVFNVEIGIICLMIAIWIPMHIWSVMIAHRNDYLNAGLNYFPLNLSVKNTAILIFVLSLLLYSISISLYILAVFKLIYLAIANILGILMIYATTRLLFNSTSIAAWKVYKLSSFPYLGIMFIAMCLDTYFI